MSNAPSEKTQALSSQQSSSQGSFLSPLFTVSHKTDPTSARVNNRMMLFNLLFPSGAYSRAELGRLTGLSRVSVSDVINDLLDGHFVCESETEQVKHRGKKGTLLRVDTSYWCILCIDLSQEYLIAGAIVSLTSQILYRVEVPVESSTDISPTIAADMAENLAKKAREDTSYGHILGVGVSVPGVMTSAGTVLNARNLNWENIDIAGLVHTRTGLKTIVNHDVNSALLSERFFGQGKKNMIFIRIGRGVGSSILVDDSIVLGANHAAGEMGHVVVDPNGPRCLCGKTGCLEALISLTHLRQLIMNEPTKKASILKQAGTYLGHALSFPTSMLNLTDVAIFGPADVVNNTFLHAVQTTVDTISASLLQPKAVIIRRCSVGDDLVVRGEAIFVLQKVLEQR